jgi:Zn-dependent metalloprotease
MVAAVGMAAIVSRKLRVGVCVLALGAGMTVAVAAPAVATPASPDDRAIASVKAHGAAVFASAWDAYQITRTIVDPDGSSHVRFNRSYQGLPVLGGDFVVHQDRQGAFVGVTNAATKPLDLTVTPAVAPSGQNSRLVVDARSGTGVLAWETVISGLGADGQTPSVLHVLSDARTGAALGSFDEVKSLAAVTAADGKKATGKKAADKKAAAKTANGGRDAGTNAVGTGNSIYSGTVAIDTTPAGVYSMVDPSHGNGTTCDMNQGYGTCTTFTDVDNVWGNGTQSDRQSAGVDAHYGAALTYDYFKNVHGRSGIFGDGAGVPSRVHYGDSYINAFWDGSQMTYGDGDENTRPLVAIDVAGHEMGHGITANIIPGGLIYAGESGGLNESASDIWANMVEFAAGNTNDPGDYLIGEEIDIFGDGRPLRYMHDPKLDGASRNCWYTGIGAIDVHYSSGVGNLAYFFLAEGSGSTIHDAPLCQFAGPVAGIGRDKAARIWFRAMDIYFTTTTQYVTAGTNDARAATLSAATDLYGRCSIEYRTVQAAWRGVNVHGEDALCPTPHDFNGDGWADLALSGGSGWTTIPMAVSHGNGSFTKTNEEVVDFPTWASYSGVKAVAGDFNGDGRADLALSGGSGWTTIPVAFSNGNGFFTVTNNPVGTFPGLATQFGAKLVAGDFNGDGRDDLALSGSFAGRTVPVAFSNGNGFFTVTNNPVGSFPSLAANSGAKLLAGDFNGDGRADLALSGGSGWSTIPVAFSNGNGSFTVTNNPVGSFPTWATYSGAKVVAGDFNGDGRADLALSGGSGWSTIPVAFSNGDGGFAVTNNDVADFPYLASFSRTQLTSGDFNGDGRADLALAGPSGWTTIPVAFSKGNGGFTATNNGVTDFPTWASYSGVKLL